MVSQLEEYNCWNEEENSFFSYPTISEGGIEPIVSNNLSLVVKFLELLCQKLECEGRSDLIEGRLSKWWNGRKKSIARVRSREEKRQAELRKKKSVIKRALAKLEPEEIAALKEHNESL